MPKEEVICSGLVERIGLKNAKIHYKSASNKIDKIENIANHKVGFDSSWPIWSLGLNDAEGFLRP